MLSLAAVAGPLLGGFITETDLFGLGWRAIFWVNVLIGALTFGIGRFVLPESRASDGAHFDLLGAVLAAATSLLLLLPPCALDDSAAH